MAALRYILLAAAITLTLVLLAHLVLPARAPIPRRTGRRGRLCIAALTAVYAVAAFFSLGSARDPQRFCSFEAGESAVLALERETAIAAVWYYPGLSTGEYTLAYSTDGVTFTPAGTMPQGYADLFKWLQPQPVDAAPATAAYVRITASAHMELGEFALYDLQGERIGVRDIAGPASADALCDEADTVPASSTYYNSTYFDEIYHARTALEHLRGMKPYEVSHPPLGKLILSLGIALFGMTPFGWRFMGALFGVAMLPVLWALLRRMFRDDRIAACGTLLFAFDFLHFTQTRIATIDTYAVFFILLMYLFFWRWLEDGRRRDLALSGLFFGVGAASKWTCLYAGAGLGALWLGHWILRGIRDVRAGEGRAYVRALAGNIPFCLLWFVLLPAAVYYVSYTPYGLANGLAAPGMYFTRDYARLVWDNQVFMFTYHANLEATHPYSAPWWQWVLDIRPILYYLRYGDETVTSIAAFVNPLLCWGGLAAIIVCAVRAVRRGDRRAAFIVVGYLAQLLPWMFVTRITFEYHYFPSTIFLVLALCAVFDALRLRGRGRPRATIPGIFSNGCPHGRSEHIGCPGRTSGSRGFPIHKFGKEVFQNDRNRQ